MANEVDPSSGSLGRERGNPSHLQEVLSSPKHWAWGSSLPVSDRGSPLSAGPELSFSSPVATQTPGSPGATLDDLAFARCVHVLMPFLDLKTSVGCA